MSLRLYVRRADLAREGEVDDFQSFVTTLRFNGVSTWVLNLAASVDAASTLGFDAGIIAVLDGDTLFSGPVTGLERAFDKSTGDRLIVSGVDDTVWLLRRLGLPVPGGPPYTATDYDVRTGAAETVLRGYVNDNAGPGATVDRRVPGLVLETDAGHGSTVTGRARFSVLIDLLAALALAGGDIGFRIVQVGTALHFQVYVPNDRTATAKFSTGLGNLSTFSYSERAASADYIYVGGGGEGTARVVVEGGDSAAIASFGRIEQFRDRRDTTDTTELAQTRDAELAQNAAVTSLSMTPVDTEAVRFGRDYGLGDKVTVVIDDVPIADLVRELNITFNKDGRVVTPLIGSPGTSKAAPEILEQRRLRRRIGHLEHQ